MYFYRGRLALVIYRCSPRNGHELALAGETRTFLSRSARILQRELLEKGASARPCTAAYDGGRPEFRSGMRKHQGAALVSCAAVLTCNSLTSFSVSVASWESWLVAPGLSMEFWEFCC